MNIRKNSVLLITIVLLFLFTACRNSNSPLSTAEPSELSQSLTITDREGKTITIPANVNKIISMAPSITETLVHLGAADKIVAIDIYSEGIEGLPANLPVFDIMAPDSESIVALQPDIVFITGMSKADGDDPFKLVTDLGVLMTCIPSSNTIEDIKKDITFIGTVIGAQDKTDTIITGMQQEIDNIVAMVGDRRDNKSVYFEVNAAPYMYSFGRGVFLDEIILLLGATNILADQDSWVSVSEELVLAKNPDVIFTNSNDINDPITEIMSRTGWNTITAVKDKQIFRVSTDASSRPNEYITITMKEIAAALYPDSFEQQ